MARTASTNKVAAQQAYRKADEVVAMLDWLKAEIVERYDQPAEAIAWSDVGDISHIWNELQDVQLFVADAQE